jgi:uncharacterized protein YciI
MKHFLIIIVLSLSFGAANAQSKAKTVKDGDFEMKEYYFVMLTKGERRGEITDTAKIMEIQRGHLANIDRLAKLGKILVAGPFGDDGNWRGIFIFDAASAEEVKQLLNTDPAIAAGRLAYEIHPWWTAKNCVFK